MVFIKGHSVAVCVLLLQKHILNPRARTMQEKPASLDHDSAKCKKKYHV